MSFKKERIQPELHGTFEIENGVATFDDEITSHSDHHRREEAFQHATLEASTATEKYESESSCDNEGISLLQCLH